MQSAGEKIGAENKLRFEDSGVSQNHCWPQRVYAVLGKAILEDFILTLHLKKNTSFKTWNISKSIYKNINHVKKETKYVSFSSSSCGFQIHTCALRIWSVPLCWKRFQGRLLPGTFSNFENINTSLCCRMSQGSGL